MTKDLNIYAPSGKTLLYSTPMNQNCKWKYQLMKEDYITVKFSLATPIHFGIGCSVEWNSETWFITSVQDPTYNTSTGGYSYELTFNHDYWLWSNRIFKFTPESGGREASWNLTDTLTNHMSIFLRNLKTLGYQYKGKDYVVSIDGTVKDVAKLVTYDNTNMIDALTAMAEAFDCEWWIGLGVIHFGRCENESKEPIEFKEGVNVEKISRSNSQQNYANRIYVFGGTNNIPARYRKKLEFDIKEQNGLEISDTARILDESYFNDSDKIKEDIFVDEADYTTFDISLNKDAPKKVYNFIKLRDGYLKITAKQFSVTVKEEGIVTLYRKYHLKLTLSYQTKKGELREEIRRIEYDTKNPSPEFPDFTFLVTNVDTDWLSTMTFEYEEASKYYSTVKFAAILDTYITRAEPKINLHLTFKSGDSKGQTVDAVLNQPRTKEKQNTIYLPEGTKTKVGDRFTIDNIIQGKVPATYFTSAYDEDMTVNGIVQKRLMLPTSWNNGHNYIDAEPNLDPNEIVESVVTNEEIFPQFASVDEDGNVQYGYTIEKVMTRQGKVEDAETKNKETVTYWAIHDDDFNFDKEYLLNDSSNSNGLQITFQSGKLNGMTFKVDFIPDGSTGQDSNGNAYNYDKGQWFEIVRSNDYQRYLPDEVLCPQPGDRYILTGFDVTYLEDGGTLVDTAEKELLKWGQQYVKKLAVDPSTYTCSMMSYLAYGVNPHTGEYDENYSYEATLNLGDPVKLFSNAYFRPDEKGDCYRISRIIGFEKNLDILYDTPQYIVGEKPAYSRIGELSDKIDEIQLNGKTFGISGGASNGTSVYVIGTGDSTPATDKNVFSAIRSLQQFLRKDQEDIAAYIIRFLEGLKVGKTDYGLDADGIGRLKQLISDNLQSNGFVSGSMGSGFVLKNEGGLSYLEVDSLLVRQIATFLKLEIRELSYVNGNIVLGKSGSKLSKVETLTGADGTVTGWKCFFTADDGTTATTNSWKAGDQARCQTFDIKPGVYQNVSNKFYWRLVTEVGDGYIVLSATDKSDTTDNTKPACCPAKGDTVVQVGYRLGYNATEKDPNDVANQERTNLIMLSTSGTDSAVPSIEMYANIHTYSLDTKAKEGPTLVARISPKEVIFNSEKLVWTNGRVNWKQYVDRGDWDPEQKYWYMDRVQHNGATWMCLDPSDDGTQEEPTWDSTKWKIVIGDSSINMVIEGAPAVNVMNPAQDLTLRVTFLSQDITDDIVAKSTVAWTRTTAFAAEDKGWKPNAAGKVLHLSNADYGSGWGTAYNQVTYTCTISGPTINAMNDNKPVTLSATIRI